MNWLRFFTGFTNISGLVLGILSFTSTIQHNQPSTATGLAITNHSNRLPRDIIRCPELFQVLNDELSIPHSYWQAVCNGADSSGNGNGSGDESGDESGSGTARTMICDFVCNDYHRGCRELANYIFSSETWARKIGCSKQKLLATCIGWQELATRPPNITSTIKTTSSPDSYPSTTTKITTTSPTTPAEESEPEEATKNKDTKSWDIAILTVLGSAITSAVGVVIYFCRKKF